MTGDKADELTAAIADLATDVCSHLDNISDDVCANLDNINDQLKETNRLLMILAKSLEHIAFNKD